MNPKTQIWEKTPTTGITYEVEYFALKIEVYWEEIDL